MENLAPSSECDDGFPPPRPFQVTAHEALRQGIRDGHKNQVLMAPTGAGKTYLGLRICKEAIAKGKRAVFLCDRTTLINQTSETADRYGLYDHGIVQANHWRRFPDRSLQIASVQTIAKRNFWPQLDVLVVDECFTGETLISTPNGLVEIRNLNTGNLIYNTFGVAKIDSVFSKKTNKLCKLRLSNGKTIRCTPDHPIFTRMGWRPAGSLGRGEELFCLQDMRSLWEKVFSKNGEIQEWKAESYSGDELFSETILQSILFQEIEEPYAQYRKPSKNEGKININWAQAKNEGRQWTWDDENSGVLFKNPWRWLVSRICSKYKQIKQTGISPSLQVRFGEPSIKNSVGVRWFQSLFSKKTATRQKERRVIASIRLESIEIEELGCDELVYNLRVSGHPSYFANGILVHNCHAMYKSWVNFANETGAFVIGLSATPFATGMGKIFTNLVNAASMYDLTQEGILVPFRIFSCRKPDMTGAETKGGEWTEKAAEERELLIVGDVVRDWHYYGENRKTIVFGATIHHCKELCRQFIESGVMAAVFTSETTEKERKELLDEYRKPDSHLKVLISVEALAKGFDVPDVGCVCDARPLRKSLSTAIQMWGRGLRASPETDKKDCIILDFSGNMIRFFEDFNEIYFNGLGRLDDGVKLDKTIREKEEFEKTGCPRCGYKPFHKRCMACGYEKPAKELISGGDGVMQEIFIGEGSKKKKLANDAKHLWDQVCSYARIYSKPESQSGRAWHLYKQITGQSSPYSFAQGAQVEITANVHRKIQSMNIAHRNRMNRS